MLQEVVTIRNGLDKMSEPLVQMENKKTNKSFEEKLLLCREVIRDSAFFREISEKIEPYRSRIKKIRCLAIGSFHEEFPARYQLALLLEIIDSLSYEDSDVEVSLFDPVFNNEDSDFIEKKRWKIEETVEWTREGKNESLFFLPHAPLDLTEKVLAVEKPRFWFANHIVAHTDRYTKSQLYEKYPVVSKLTHVLKDETHKGNDDQKEDDFSTFVPKRKRRNRKNKFKEPEIDYEVVDTYFQSCRILTDFEMGSLTKNQPWVNSFSDLAFQLID